MQLQSVCTVQYLKREVTEANEEIRRLKEQLEETLKHLKEVQDIIAKLLNEASVESLNAGS